MKKDKIIKKLLVKNYERVLDVGSEVDSVEFLKFVLPDSKIFGVNLEKDVLPTTDGSIIATAEVLPFKNNCFDLIFAREVIEHLFYPDKFLSEVKRVLKNHGEMILTTPNLNAWQNRILILLGFALTNYTPFPKKTYGLPKFFKTKPLYDHPRVFPYNALKKIFNSNGFKLEKIIGANQTEKGRWLKKLRKLMEIILPNSWKEDIIVKVKIVK